MTYDGMGQLINDSYTRAGMGNGTRQYDADGRLISARVNENKINNTEGAVYDAIGRRVLIKKADGTSTRFIYGAGGELVAEYESTNVAPSSPAVEYAYRAGAVLIEARSSGNSWRITDSLGTIRATINSSGALVSRTDHMPFGEELSVGISGRTTAMGYGVTSTSRQKFTGLERDTATNYDHTLWRKLDSVQGRWTSPDPFLGSMVLENPQTFNRYGYVSNDPVNNIDPLGLRCYFVHNYIDQTDDDGNVIGRADGGLSLECDFEVFEISRSFLQIALNNQFQVSDVAVGGSRLGGTATAVTPKTNNEAVNRSLARCYDQALRAYRAGKNSIGKVGQGLDVVKGFSPLSVTGGFNSIVGGAVGVATRGRVAVEAGTAVQGITSAFGAGFARGGAGSGAAAATSRFGTTTITGKILGGIGAGLAFGGLFVQGFDAAAGPEAFLRKAIQECNSAHPGASGAVTPTILQFPTSNSDAAQSYVDDHS